MRKTSHLLQLLLVAAFSCAVSAPAAKVDDKRGITYTLNNPDSWPPKIRERIEKSMEEAVETYNRYGTFNKAVRVSYNPKIPTADGNFNGSIRFGKSISSRTAMHEISHTLGIGQHWKYRQMMEGGRWSGPQANKLIEKFNGKNAVLKGDKAHFWPYGLNHKREDSEKARERHVRMVEAILLDMDIGTVRK